MHKTLNVILNILKWVGLYVWKHHWSMIIAALLIMHDTYMVQLQEFSIRLLGIIGTVLIQTHPTFGM
jgi:hypothetical protein